MGVSFSVARGSILLSLYSVGRFDPALLPSERDMTSILAIGKEIANHLEQPSV